MSPRYRIHGQRFGITVAVFLAVLALMMVRAPRTGAQEAKRAPGPPASSGSDIARGAYIVNNVAMCPTCHTPHLPDGSLDRSRWLQGGPIVYLPSQPTPNWPQLEPRIGGTLPTSEAGMINLLTTAVWIDGTELRDPMPKFHMTRSDAEAVIAYLKSISAGH